MRAVNSKPPSNHLAFAIVVTLLCCVPTGIVAIVYAARVDSLFHAGDPDAAKRASESARNWAIASVVLGLLAWPVAMFLIAM